MGGPCCCCTGGGSGGPCCCCTGGSMETHSQSRRTGEKGEDFGEQENGREKSVFLCFTLPTRLRTSKFAKPSSWCWRRSKKLSAGTKGKNSFKGHSTRPVLIR
ncbi:hypothetical protein PAHAL_5G212800 [Panicum hallii]|uniref:Uncharacterized protein n=1 Tax=Panicum hallii TaxID=206008 RepID=A0A2T8IKQ9_9POAL|nr:hypothetical protein PAHAL_5G212800 [Panicum hallii]